MRFRQFPKMTISTSYRLQFNSSVRFMAGLSNLANNLTEGIHKIKCKYKHDDNKCEACGIYYKNCDCSLKYINIKDNLIECLCCNENYQKKL